MKHLILPITKFSFYAGNVTFSIAQNVIDLYERCKELLDTNGNFWADPITDFSQFDINILPLVLPKVRDDESMKACSSLLTKLNDDDNEEDMIVSLPKLEIDDDSRELLTIWLPLKQKHVYNINSKTSAFILFRYFVIVTQCYSYQGINQSIFNRRLKLWINENVLQYLDDDKLYPAFGAVLRIMESIKDSGDSIQYTGNKGRRTKKQRQMPAISSSYYSNNDQDEFSFDDENRDIYWWMNAIIASAGIVILICLILYLITRICCNRKKSKEAQYGTKNHSLKEKIFNVLRQSTHIPENDEFYEYKKLPSGKGIKFENEKLRKSNKKLPKSRKKDEINLPILNKNYLSESEDDIVLHETKKLKTPYSTSASSINTSTKKLIDKNIFKISEDSDDGIKRSSSATAKSKSILEKLRSKSPGRKKKPTYSWERSSHNE